jgi:antitoxin MazE
VSNDEGVAMRVQIKKWGNSASVRIPTAIMASASLSLDQDLDIFEQNGSVIIRPIITPVYELDDLLAQMTPDTFHDDTDFGAPVGGEVW